jgi:segregation and condensation protein A
MAKPSDPERADPKRADPKRADPKRADPDRADPEPAGPEPAAPERGEPPGESLVLRLDGFEGPLDLLLELARAQKVDLAKISILALVEQFLAVIEGARRVRLELAADWLVMAAWLAWLKSRLLVPASLDDAEEGELAAESLAERLRELGAIRSAASWLAARPVLGQDVFARGAPEDHTEIDRSRLVIEIGGFVRSYLQAIRRGTKAVSYRPRALTLWTVQDALRRLGMLLGSLPDWASLDRYLPESLAGTIEWRAALASTLLAGLEMARDGSVRLRQDNLFGPILVRRGNRGVEEGA